MGPIGPEASEMSFESVGRQQTTTDNCLSISSPGAFSSGKLKSKGHNSVYTSLMKMNNVFVNI